ncbi:MAG TPA: DHA2 family efflux MFS transporter permease subunit [Gaiellaceae bacterium]|nr:DHA2 family efflux MFS transporter permease subunit [Gaiellaceae bacterium]
MIEATRRKWYALALLLGVQFMVVLDIAIVNVALPSIQTDLGFSQANLQWVVSAYALLFGGFLLLGGRVADLIGRRRVFVVGLVVFTGASLLSGLSWSEGSLIGARALQGFGAAMITPAALSILTTTFAEGKERNTALGAWGGVGAFGAVAGVLLGGVLTELLSWNWIFFVNVPVGLIGLALAPILLTESRDARIKTFDLPGAALVTGGLVTLVYAITQANSNGWGSVETIALFAASLVILAAFAAWEARNSEPLVPFSIFRLRTVVGANVAGLILGTAIFAMFLMLTLYMQQVLHYSAMKTGVAYLAVAGTAIFWSALAAQLVTRVGVKPVLVGGMTALSAGLIYFTQVSAGGSYLGDLLPGLLLIAVGLGFSFVPISIAALAGVEPAEAGLASGLINMSQQIGGALGIAALSAIATSTTHSSIVSGTLRDAALTDGFQAAFMAAAGVALAGILVALLVVRRSDLDVATDVIEETPALEAA